MIDTVFEMPNENTSNRIHTFSLEENPSTLLNIPEIKILKFKNIMLRLQCNIMKREKKSFNFINFQINAMQYESQL